MLYTVASSLKIELKVNFKCFCFTASLCSSAAQAFHCGKSAGLFNAVQCCLVRELCLSDNRLGTRYCQTSLCNTGHSRCDSISCKVRVAFCCQTILIVELCGMQSRGVRG